MKIVDGKAARRNIPDSEKNTNTSMDILAAILVERMRKQNLSEQSGDILSRQILFKGESGLVTTNCW